MNFILATVLVILAVANAEYCTYKSECIMTTCGNGYTDYCFARDNSHVCSCIPANQGSTRCTTIRDPACQKAFGSCHHGDHIWHCDNNKCVCSWHHSNL